MVARLSITGETRAEAFTSTSSLAVLPSDLEGQPNHENVVSIDMTSETEAQMGIVQSAIEQENV